MANNRQRQTISISNAPLSLPPETLALLRQATSVMVLTGAGISAESGVPTFRAPGTGLWGQYRIEDFATPRAWRRDPKLVWGWYTHRRRLARRVQPNPGHLALARLGDFYPDFTVVTQNVDGLHTHAGSRRVVELHGSLFSFRCTSEDTTIPYDDPDDENPEAMERLERGEGPAVPTCPNCGALLRPDVVWFEEPLPADVLWRAQAAAEQCDICLVVGTSAQVYPASALPQTARRRGAFIVEVNPEETDLTSQSHLSLRGPAGLALPQLTTLIVN